jgi:hypothetical protein
MLHHVIEMLALLLALAYPLACSLACLACSLACLRAINQPHSLKRSYNPQAVTIVRIVECMEPKALYSEIQSMKP